MWCFFFCFFSTFVFLPVSKITSNKYTHRQSWFNCNKYLFSGPAIAGLWEQNSYCPPKKIRQCLLDCSLPIGHSRSHSVQMEQNSATRRAWVGKRCIIFHHAYSDNLFSIVHSVEIRTTSQPITVPEAGRFVGVTVTNPMSPHITCPILTIIFY